MPLLQHLAIPIILHFILVEVSLLFILLYNFEKNSSLQENLKEWNVQIMFIQYMLSH